MKSPTEVLDVRMVVRMVVRWVVLPGVQVVVLPGVRWDAANGNAYVFG